MKSITQEVAKLSLEEQQAISNNILKQINKTIVDSIAKSIEPLNSLMKGLGDVNGKTILILQPEKYMTLGIILMLNGAGMVYGLNRFIKSEKRLSTYYDKLLTFIIKNKKQLITSAKLTDDEISERFNEIVSTDSVNMRAYLNRDMVRFSLGEDISMMPYDDEMFDIVISDHVISTLYYPFSSINELRRVMADSAMIYMITCPYGRDVKTSRQLADRLKSSHELFEKNFSYASADYCNRLQKSDVEHYLNDFNIKVESIEANAKINIAPFDKKDIDESFLLSGTKNLSTISYTIVAHKQSNKKENFSEEDFHIYAKGLDLHHRGKYNVARARFESLMRKHPKDIRVTHSLFSSLYFLKDYQKAFDTYKLINKRKYSPTARDRYYVGDALFNIERYKEAKKFFAAVAEIDPKQHMAYNAIGLCDYRTGEVSAGLKNIKKSVKLFPYFSEGLGNIGMILETIDKSKAVEHFKIVLTLDPGHKAALFSMGRLLYERERYEDAGKYLNEYCIVTGSQGTAFKMYIDCLMKMGLKRTAKKEIETVMNNNPTDLSISRMFETFMDDSLTS